jgi:hypothetical protein
MKQNDDVSMLFYKGITANPGDRTATKWNNE